MKKTLLYLFLAVLLPIASCTKDDPKPEPNPDPDPIVEPDPDPTPDPEPEPVDVSVQDFMWKAMNLYYFWQQDVADLADDRFATVEDYGNFLASKEPAKLMEDLLLKMIDLLFGTRLRTPKVYQSFQE